MNQVMPYISLMRNDTALQRLIRGLIWRHAYYVALDPYANAFKLNDEGVSPNIDDHTSRPAYLG